MKKPADLLMGVLVLAVGLVTVLAPIGGASFRWRAATPPGFSESLLLSARTDGGRLSADVFRALGGLRRVVVGQYEVQPQDTLTSVANTFGTQADYLRSTNRLSSAQLSPGKTLWVHNGQGMLYQVRERQGRVETLHEIAKRHNLSVGTLARTNRLPGVALLSDVWLQPGQTLLLPTVRLRFIDYLIPVEWRRGQRLISSGFGLRRHPVLRKRRFHQGLDLRQPAGAPVRASREGVVIFAGWRGAYGQLIIVKHPNGLCTWYGHLSAMNVDPGQRVAKGAFIGRVGSTGLTTGPHLHFEVRDRYGRALNPKKFLF